MIINVVNAVKETTFESIEQGNFFAPYPHVVYLKIEERFDNQGREINAVDMEGGHLAFFNKNDSVYALDVTMEARFSHYDYSIEC